MLTLKTIHVFSAYTTGIGFLIRGILVLSENSLSRHRMTKTLPHLVDTVLLVSGIMMVYSWAVSPLSQPWLLAKGIALLPYIFFGFIMLRWGSTKKRRWIGLTGGLTLYVYIVGVAHSKSITSFLSYFL